MWRRIFVSMLALATWLAAPAQALELKNIRMAYGAGGAPRTDNKFLPGDIMLVTYDIDGLTVDKAGKVSYEGVMEIFDSKKTRISSKNIPLQEVVLQLGGNSIPGDLTVTMGSDQPPGIYTVKLTVTDKVAKKSAPLTRQFELLKTGYGIIRLGAPAYGVPGQHYPLAFFLVNSPLDKKTKLPMADIIMRVFEEGKKGEAARPVVTSLPAQLPADVDVQIIPVQFSIYLNRPGRFTVEIEVQERLTNKKLKVPLPLTVIGN